LLVIQGIQNVLGALDQEAQARIAGVSTSGGLGGNTPSPSSSSSTGSGKFNW